jgi:subtilisin-like proprotein convertase family protein
VSFNYRTGLALVAGLTVMAVGAQRMQAAVTMMSTNVPKTILNNTTVTSTLNFTVNAIATDVDVAGLNITHTWAGDIDISLARPGGPQVMIFGDCGGSDDNFTNVTISDEGAAPKCPTNGFAHTGILRGAPNGVPSTNVMTAFDGSPALGIWSIVITDDSEHPEFDESPGALTSWGITVDFPFPIPPEIAKVEDK